MKSSRELTDHKLLGWLIGWSTYFFNTDYSMIYWVPYSLLQLLNLDEKSENNYADDEDEE